MSDLYLYHATGKKYLQSILSKGLLINPPEHAYEKDIGIEALKDKIFLALNAEAAVDYAETSYAFDNDDIIVFKIKLNSLNAQYFKYDWNNRCEYTNDINSCVYEQDIPATLLSICEPNKEPEQNIDNFYGTDLYEHILAVFDEEVMTNKEREDYY